MKITTHQLRQIIREEIGKLKSEAQKPKIKKFDDVHVKSKNQTGMVYDIRGNDVVIKTIKGLIKAKMSDLVKIGSDNDDDFVF